MARLVSLVGVLVILVFSFAALGDSLLILNPSDPSLSSTDRGTMLSAISSLETRLGEGFPIAKQQLVRRGWSAGDFAQFVRGLLEAEGYAVEVVLRKDGVSAWYWLLVAVPLADGIVTWVPVEVTTSLTPDWWSLGRIPWAEGASRFDEAFMSYDEVVRLPPNVSPSVAIVQPRRVAADGASTLLVSGQDPDGSIVVYVWSVDGEWAATETRSSVELFFSSEGDHLVSVTAYDDRGAQTTATLEVYVYDVVPDCNCH